MPSPIAFNATTVAQVTVTDFQRAVKWYGEKLGFEPDYLMEEMGWGELKTNVPGLTLGISRADAAAKESAVTLVLNVTDIEAARKSLELSGVKFDGPTEEIPGMVKLATFRDPDGNAFSFAQSLMS